MHMICICKWRLPGCVRNKHSKIFSTEKPLLQRETLKFVWTLVRSKSASPDGAVDLHPRRVRPRPSHLSVLLPPHHPSHCQSCLRDIPGEATTRHSDSPSLPASLPGAGADGGKRFLPGGGDGTVSPEWTIAGIKRRKRDLSTQAKGDAGHPLLVNQVPLHMPPVWGVALETPRWQLTSIRVRKSPTVRHQLCHWEAPPPCSDAVGISH